jgi:ubiquinone/menaquinone biosynthesis C-methylase UbiE
MLLRTRNVDVVSLDFSPVAIRIHKQKDPEAVTVQASLEDPLPFDDASFDRIACLSVLFTISPQGARLALSEFRRILRPGGLLVLTAMMPGHSKLRGFCSHVAKRIRVAGRRNILGEFKASIFPVAKMLYYNIRMYALRRQHGYRRFTQSELIEETRRAGFADLRWRLTYGGRFLMVVGHAPQDDLWHPDAGVAARAAVHPLALSGA